MPIWILLCRSSPRSTLPCGSCRREAWQNRNRPYRTEKITGGTSGAASAVDERGAAVGNQRDGHGAELERDAQNAARSVSAADAVGRGPENAPDEGGRAGIPDQNADKRRKIRETGWEPEREVFFHLQRADREYQNGIEYDDEGNESAAFQYGTGRNEENSSVRADFDYGGDLVRGAVRLGRAVEQMTDDVPQRDASTMPPHIDSKRRKKLRQKKTALGHAEGDHADWTMEQHL